MKKKCATCGNEFEAKESRHRFCPKCHASSANQKAPPTLLTDELLIKKYFDENENPLRELYIGTPEKLSDIFYQGKDGLSTKQLRDFFRIITRALRVAQLKGISFAKPILYECFTHLNYQLKREKIPKSFENFMKHHIAIIDSAQDGKKALEGFYAHFRSILCCYPKK